MFWGQKRQDNAMAKVQPITPEELKQRLGSENPPVLIDVRSVEEYQHDGHIAGARLLPLPLLPLRRSEIPTNRQVVMVCRSGARSNSACEHLINNGYTQVYNLIGGMGAWQRAGFAKK